jgi:hypothetical protein
MSKIVFEKMHFNVAKMYIFLKGFKKI